MSGSSPLRRIRVSYGQTSKEIDMTRHRRNVHLRPFIAFLVGIFAATATAEDAWTQEKANALATTLATSLEAAVTQAESGPAQAEAIQQRKLEAALIDLRQMSRMANDLARKLDAGEGRDETTPLVRQISLQREAVQFYAKDTTVRSDTRETSESAIAALSELEALYAKH